MSTGCCHNTASLALHCLQGASSSAAAAVASESPVLLPPVPAQPTAVPPAATAETDRPASPFAHDEGGDSLPEFGWDEDEDEDQSWDSASEGDEEEDGDEDEDEDGDDGEDQAGRGGVAGVKRRAVDVDLEQPVDDDARESDEWSQPWSDDFADVKDSDSEVEYDQPGVKAHETEPIEEVSELVRTFYTRCAVLAIVHWLRVIGSEL